MPTISERSHSNDEMTLLELWQMLCAGWRLMLGGLLAGLAVAGAYLAITPNQYEATLLIKVGQVSLADSVKQVEAPGDVIKRLQAPDFGKAVVESLGWTGDVRGRLFVSSLQSTSPADAHVKIRLRSLTPDDARRAAEAAFNMIDGAHRVVIKKVVANNEQQLAVIGAEIADTEALLGRLERLLGKETPRNDLQGVLMWQQIKEWLQVTQEQKKRLSALRLQESALRETLNPESMVPTAVVEPVVVSPGAVYPQARRIWLLSGIGGLLLGVLLITLRSLFDMKKKSSPSAGSI